MNCIKDDFRFCKVYLFLFRSSSNISKMRFILNVDFGMKMKIPINEHSTEKHWNDHFESQFYSKLPLIIRSTWAIAHNYWPQSFQTSGHIICFAWFEWLLLFHFVRQHRKSAFYATNFPNKFLFAFDIGHKWQQHCIYVHVCVAMSISFAHPFYLFFFCRFHFDARKMKWSVEYLIHFLPFFTDKLHEDFRFLLPLDFWMRVI